MLLILLAVLGVAFAQTPASTIDGRPTNIPVPGPCVSTCALIASTMGNCDYNPTASNPQTACACTTQAYSAIFNCYECLAGQTPAQIAYLQSNLNNYLTQCRTAPVNPVNLQNLTITQPPASATAAPSSSASVAVPSVSGSSSAKASSSAPSSVVSQNATATFAGSMTDIPNMSPPSSAAGRIEAGRLLGALAALVAFL